jgi:hypothetical protein
MIAHELETERLLLRLGGGAMRRLALLVALAALCACGVPGGGPEPPKPGTMRLSVEGREVELKVEVLDVYLVENPDAYPESYVLRGPDVGLVGKFPQDLHVGYGEKFDLLKQRPITILRETGLDVEESPSFVTLPGAKPVDVTGGTIKVERVDGSTLSGTVLLQFADRAPVSGTFAVEAKTWG